MKKNVFFFSVSILCIFFLTFFPLFSPFSFAVRMERFLVAVVAGVPPLPES